MADSIQLGIFAFLSLLLFCVVLLQSWRMGNINEGNRRLRERNLFLESQEQTNQKSMEEYRQIISSLTGNAKPIISGPVVAQSEITTKSKNTSTRINGLQTCPTKPRLNPVDELTKVLGKEQANV